jgi:hypothetical protein
LPLFSHLTFQLIPALSCHGAFPPPLPILILSPLLTLNSLLSDPASIPRFYRPISATFSSSSRPPPRSPPRLPSPRSNLSIIPTASIDARTFALFALAPAAHTPQQKRLLESVLQLQLRCRDSATAWAVLVCCDSFTAASRTALPHFAKRGVVARLRGRTAAGALRRRGRPPGMAMLAGRAEADAFWKRSRAAVGRAGFCSPLRMRPRVASRLCGVCGRRRRGGGREGTGVRGRL